MNGPSDADLKVPEGPIGEPRSKVDNQRRFSPKKPERKKGKQSNERFLSRSRFMKKEVSFCRLSVRHGYEHDRASEGSQVKRIFDDAERRR